VSTIRQNATSAAVVGLSQRPAKIQSPRARIAMAAIVISRPLIEPMRRSSWAAQIGTSRLVFTRGG
jgi:hypothetical protein